MKFILSESQFKKIVSYLAHDKSFLNEASKRPTTKSEITKFQNWVINTKKDRTILGRYGADGVWGDFTQNAWDKYGSGYGYHSFFYNKAQGNKFREWVNKYYPKIAKKYDLDLKGPHDNYTIRKVAAQKVDINTKKIQNRILNPTGSVNLGTLFFQQNADAYNISSEKGQTLPSLVKTGFKINKESWSPAEGYYVDKCTQEGCAQYTYDMIGDKFGDAWQAYKSFNKYSSVSPDTVSKMENIFNSINKKGFPQLNAETGEDDVSKKLLISLVPSQKQFKNLKLGDVVGLYYPDSSNYDLAFFQSAIGKSRDQDGNWVGLTSPYFCTDPSKCDETKWTLQDIKSDKSFKAGPSLKSGKSFMPNTHLGFIGYIDENGEPYVVHNVHKKVYAFPVSKMIPGVTLSIVWSGSPK